MTGSIGDRPTEGREAKLRALQKTLDRSIAEGGEVSEAELYRALAVKAAELAAGSQTYENRGILTFGDGR